VCAPASPSVFTVLPKYLKVTQPGQKSTCVPSHHTTSSHCTAPYLNHTGQPLLRPFLNMAFMASSSTSSDDSSSDHSPDMHPSTSTSTQATSPLSLAASLATPDEHEHQEKEHGSSAHSSARSSPNDIARVRPAGRGGCWYVAFICFSFFISLFLQQLPPYRNITDDMMPIRTTGHVASDERCVR
jgi:hypothetical protein